MPPVRHGAPLRLPAERQVPREGLVPPGTASGRTHNPQRRPREGKKVNDVGSVA